MCITWNKTYRVYCNFSSLQIYKEKCFQKNIKSIYSQHCIDCNLCKSLVPVCKRPRWWKDKKRGKKGKQEGNPSHWNQWPGQWLDPTVTKGLCLRQRQMQRFFLILKSVLILCKFIDKYFTKKE